jgi:hypothetical protein
MARVKYTTNIDKELLRLAKDKAQQDGLDGGNAVIEAALRLYFANCSTQVWEKSLSGGWIKKIIVRPGKVVIESIRSRTVRSRYNPRYFTDEALQPKGWTKVWKMKNGS